MSSSRAIGARVADHARGVLADTETRRVVLDSLAILTLGAASGAAFASGWDSPIRVTLALGFLLFGPGLAFGQLLHVRDPVQRLAIATGSSFALETLIALALIYSGAYSAGLAFGLVLAVTAAAVVGSLVRAFRPQPSIRGQLDRHV